MDLKVFLIFGIFFVFETKLSSDYDLYNSKFPIYFGNAKPNVPIVEITPPIKLTINEHSTSKKICEVTLHSLENNFLPFKVIIKNPYEGLVDLRLDVSYPVDELASVYTFEIVATDCDQNPKFSPKANVVIEVSKFNIQKNEEKNMDFFNNNIENKHIEVNDAQVPKEEFHFTISASIMPFSPIAYVDDNQILKYYPGNYFVCKHQLTNKDGSTVQDFNVDDNGSIKTNKQLDFSKITRYELVLNTQICDKTTSNLSKTHRINIFLNLQSKCQPHWEHIPKELTIRERQLGIESLFKSQHSLPNLNLCDIDCSSPHIVVQIKLGRNSSDSQNDEHMAEKEFISSDRCSLTDSSLAIQRLSCGISKKTVSLLPTKEEYLQWKNKQPINSKLMAEPSLGKERKIVENNIEAEMPQFDGESTYWEVTEEQFSQTHLFGSSFSFAFWMRHAEMSNANSKERILCSSNAQGETSVIYSVFMQNCELHLTIQNNNPSLGQFTEWIFKTDDMRQIICMDSRNWHHFSISKTQSNQIELFVDGKYWEPIPVIVKNNFVQQFYQAFDLTKLVVGACYQASTNSYADFLQADIVGMTLLVDEIEPPSVLRCLAKCGQTLHLANLEKVLKSGTSISITSTAITIDGTNVPAISEVLNEVNYVNTDKRRFVQQQLNDKSNHIVLSTNIKCTVSKVEIKTSDQVIGINLIGRQDFIKLIPFVSNRVSAFYSDQGVNILKDLNFFGLPSPSYNGAQAKVFTQKELDNTVIDSCLLRIIKNPLDIRFEYLDWPIDLAKQLGLLPVNNSHGLVLEGSASSAIYKQLLSQVKYKLIKSYLKFLPTVSRFEHKFSLICSQQNNQYLTLQREVELSVDVSQDINTNTPNKRIPQDNGFFEFDADKDIKIESENKNKIESALNSDFHDFNGYMNDDHVAAVQSDKKQIIAEPAKEFKNPSINKILKKQEFHQEQYRGFWVKNAGPVIMVVLVVALGVLLIVATIFGVVRCYRAFGNDIREEMSDNGEDDDDCNENMSKSNQYMNYPDNGIRPYVVYRNPLEAEFNEPIVEVGFGTNGSSPYCPVENLRNLSDSDSTGSFSKLNMLQGKVTFLSETVFSDEEDYHDEKRSAEVV